MSLVEVRINQSQILSCFTSINVFPQKRDLLTVEVNQFWIVEEKPVERNTCTRSIIIFIMIYERTEICRV